MTVVRGELPSKSSDARPALSVAMARLRGGVLRRGAKKLTQGPVVISLSIRSSAFDAETLSSGDLRRKGFSPSSVESSMAEDPRSSGEKSATILVRKWIELSSSFSNP